MGLDQYAYIVEDEDLQGDIIDLNDRISDRIIDREFGYWRKFYALQDYMSKMYYSRGGEADSFNCVAMKFLDEDLNYLETEGKKAMLLQIGYFAEQEGGLDSYSVNALLQFIHKARLAMEQGNAVIYDSWW